MLMPQRFAVDALPATPWKNGGGSTREIACWPQGAGFEGFDWRVSIATIAASGPFSRFAGVDRIITLLDGPGVHMQGEGVDHRLDTPLAPFAFSGDVAIEGTLLGGVGCSDFNVMTRRGRLRAQVQVLRGAADLAPAPHGLLLAWQGDWRAGDQALAQGQGLWWADAPAGWRLQEDEGNAPAALLAVQWQIDEGASS
ncbi:HutD family protein [Xenophilus arseniciresistens]|uniref:HutD family protein n=1 Tax=Xenophilus arseniciresistens TaxID=1283306 RepID=A0AAE3NCV2_9BURK|nr:HutD family protein [Xenophilus arseniciresistens]MDA7419063.1 HutD family protein [Xenophilus arseniciresistens]